MAGPAILWESAIATSNEEEVAGNGAAREDAEDAIVDLADEGPCAAGAMGLASRGSFRLGEDRSFEQPINAADTAMSATNPTKRGPCHMR